MIKILTNFHLPDWPLSRRTTIIKSEININELKPHHAIIKKMKVSKFTSKEFSIYLDCITNTIKRKKLN